MLPTSYRAVSSKAHSVARLEFLMTCIRNLYVSTMVKMRNRVVSSSCPASMAIHAQWTLMNAWGVKRVPPTMLSGRERRLVP